MMYKLNRKIIIEKYAGKIKDENGNIIEQYEEYYSCWAGFRAMSGKKFAEQQSTLYKRVDSFIVRYCGKTKDLLEEDLEKFTVILGNKRYKIAYPYDIKDEHKYIDLECECIE